MNTCAQCSDVIEKDEGLFVDFILDKTFCFKCTKNCTKCNEPTYFHTEILENKNDYGGLKYHMFCMKCYDEYLLYLNPPCPSHLP